MGAPARAAGGRGARRECPRVNRQTVRRRAPRPPAARTEVGYLELIKLNKKDPRRRGPRELNGRCCNIKVD